MPTSIAQRSKLNEHTSPAHGGRQRGRQAPVTFLCPERTNTAGRGLAVAALHAHGTGQAGAKLAEDMSLQAPQLLLPLKTSAGATLPAALLQLAVRFSAL